METSRTVDRKDDMKDFVSKCREAAEYMRLLQHCKTCDGCCNPGCKLGKELLAHVEICEGLCSRPGCEQTKKILRHRVSCRLNRQQAFLTGTPAKFCLICSLAVRDEGVPGSRNGCETPEKRRLSEPEFAVPGLPKRLRESFSPEKSRKDTFSPTGVESTTRLSDVVETPSIQMRLGSVPEEDEEVCDDTLPSPNDVTSSLSPVARAQSLRKERRCSV